MAALDLQSLKSYVSGGAPRPLSSNVATMDVEHNLIKQRFVEIAFDINSNIEGVKHKVYTLCGSQPHFQKLTLHSGGRSVSLDDDNRSFASYGAVGGTNQSGQWLQVQDLDPYALGRGGALDDVSLVEKYVMTDEEYGKRENTYRNFKAKKREVDPNWTPIHAKPKPNVVAQPSEEEIRARISVGMRAQVQPGSRRGEVKFVGSVPECGAGIWIGIALDEPLGKHDGAILGKRYFTCSARHGTFVRSTKCEVGDYPELDPFDSDNDEAAAGEHDDDEEKDDIYQEL